MRVSVNNAVGACACVCVSVYVAPLNHATTISSSYGSFFIGYHDNLKEAEFVKTGVQLKFLTYNMHSYSIIIILNNFFGFFCGCVVCFFVY